MSVLVIEKDSEGEKPADRVTLTTLSLRWSQAEPDTPTPCSLLRFSDIRGQCICGDQRHSWLKTTRIGDFESVFTLLSERDDNRDNHPINCDKLDPFLKETMKGCRSLTVQGCQTDAIMESLLGRMDIFHLANLRSLTLFGVAAPPTFRSWLNRLYGVSRRLSFLQVDEGWLLPRRATSTLRTIILKHEHIGREALRFLFLQEHLRALGLCMSEFVSDNFTDPETEDTFLQFDRLHTLMLDIGRSWPQPTSMLKLLPMLKCTKLQSLRIGHDDKDPFDRSIFWKELAKQNWPLSTLQLGIGRRPTERAAQYHMLQTVSGTLQTLACRYADVGHVLSPHFPILPTLTELVLTNGAAEEPLKTDEIPCAMEHVRSLVAHLKTSKKATHLREVRLLFCAHFQAREHLQQEHPSWPVGVVVYTSWNESPFLGADAPLRP
ncbi:hypothetical protein CALCODRAFT_321157 [Calocera cornea HHB12733]|uniref:Uncharacterized protein n=1 Tax=Calocera cornea HHB12733 TaxID=1353952 RepID=A0A165F656_9BASI|nr:hypothetical protein CALCODRAFT_321157 [Calocera cornea HHB12733]